jgi:hypothetical protein
MTIKAAPSSTGFAGNGYCIVWSRSGVTIGGIGNTSQPGYIHFGSSGSKGWGSVCDEWTDEMELVYFIHLVIFSSRSGLFGVNLVIYRSFKTDWDYSAAW